MDKIIKYYIKKAYGRALVYITTDHKAAIQKLTGRETLTDSDIDALKTLGYTFEQVQDKETLQAFKSLAA